MKVMFITNEYPPYIYGGAGVHVEYLSKELAKLMEVEVRSFHDQKLQEGNLTVNGTTPDAALFKNCPKELASPLKAFYEGLVFAGENMTADVAHCHTWYAHFAGILAKMLYGIPLVVTVHSLEPLRPWKREQLGRGYDVSSWVEKTALEMADAVIAVSTSTKEDVLRLFPKIDPDKVSIIYNGIDVNQYKEVENTAVLQKFGIRTDKPYVLFVGRMTRQKGLLYLLKAAAKLDPDAQLVLCAGDADTPEMQAELEGMVNALKQIRSGVVWIPEMVRAKKRLLFILRRRCSAARRFTNRSALSIWKPWPAARPSSPARSAALKRSSLTAKPDSWLIPVCPTNRRTTRKTQTLSPPVWPKKSTS